jgi:hypothetical protein
VGGTPGGRACWAPFTRRIGVTPGQLRTPSRIADEPTLDKLLAAAAPIRVAERSASRALPEGGHGIFVGGAGSVSVPRLIGTARRRDMMLTGRAYGAEEGAALGFAHYVVEDSHGLAKGIELAERVASHAALSSVAVLPALPRIAQVEPETGLLLESLTAGQRLRPGRQLPRPGAARLPGGGDRLRAVG